MRNENLLELMYKIAEAGSLSARELKPGGVTDKTGYGDNKRDIDQVAEEAIVSNFLDEGDGYNFDSALKPEDAEWGEDQWLKPSEATISGENLDEVDYALIVDQVEGTKNYDNRDRYTTVAALNPEEPTLEGVESSMVYRWDDTVFFSDGKSAYQNFEPDMNRPSVNLGEAEILEAERMDEVNYDTKIRGQMIGLNARDYANFIEKIVEKYELKENDWPSLKADGTTTGDILGAITDNSITLDIRELKGRKRLPFTQDFAPSARIARDAGAEIINEEGEKIETDFTEPGAATAYLALPPGEISRDIKSELPEILEE